MMLSNAQACSHGSAGPVSKAVAEGAKLHRLTCRQHDRLVPAAESESIAWADLVDLLVQLLHIKATAPAAASTTPSSTTD